MKSLLTGKDPDAGKDWREREKGAGLQSMESWRVRHDWATSLHLLYKGGNAFKDLSIQTFHQVWQPTTQWSIRSIEGQSPCTLYLTPISAGYSLAFIMMEYAGVWWTKPVQIIVPPTRPARLGCSPSEEWPFPALHPSPSSTEKNKTWFCIWVMPAMFI